jgi:hypothetical protein
MKVRIECEYGGPEYYLCPAKPDPDFGPEGILVEVDDLTVARWKTVIASSQQVHQEMAELYKAAMDKLRQ